VAVDSVPDIQVCFCFLVGTISFVYGLVAVDEGVEQDCRLHAEPSNGAAGDYLGEED
jgi:hypothetical protein